MKNNHKHIQAMTLTELLVVISIMVIILGVAAPVAKKLSQTLGESTGMRGIIAAAMANARAIAVREQKYAGVRFQVDSTGKQYLILVVHDPNTTGLANGFRPMDGKKPMALPEFVRVISTRVQDRYDDVPLADWDLADKPSDADTWMNADPGKNDASTFTVVFNPSGKFVVHVVCVVFGTGFSNFRQDGINTVSSTNPNALAGYQEENSVGHFKIYNVREFEKIDATQRWTKYLSTIDKDFINPYTGELIKKN